MCDFQMFLSISTTTSFYIRYSKLHG